MAIVIAGSEHEANRRALVLLSSAPWAAELLTMLQGRGGLKAPRPLLFELRYAAEIQLAGLTATYEFKTGVGKSSVDFCLHSHPEWLVEVFSPEPHSSPDEESQMRKLAGVLSDKVWHSSGVPSKFPLPSSRFHLLLLDVRQYLLGMGDYRDWRQIAYGPQGLKAQDDWATHYHDAEAIRGPFDARSPVPSAATFKERIHFIGFVNEKTYEPHELRLKNTAYYLGNPFLFTDNDMMMSAFKSYPLRPYHTDVQ